MRSSVNAIVAAALLLAGNTSSFAAGEKALQMPSEQDINVEMEKHRQEAAALLKQPIPVARAVVPTVEVPVVNAPPPRKRQSLDDILKQYEEVKNGVKPKRKESDLIIFVSFSMPKDVLKELSRQAKVTGATMVVRGFKNGSLKATKLAALEVNRGGAPWEIHPELFKAFKVTKVPTFVVATADAESVLDNGCSPEASFTSVSGNISTELALDTIRRRAQPSIASLAAARLAKLRGKNDSGHLR